ncbi:MAG: xylulokinase [Spirochaetes bacterium]|nr:xylulokinase [Spirochaetota bacterium]
MYLGIDLGTSSVKMLLMSKEGEIIATITEEYPVYYFNENWAEQDPEDWWQAVLKGMEKILSNKYASQLRGISFSGQMHGLVILDEADQVIRPAILWCDQRTQKECDDLNTEIGVDKLIQYCGNIALTGFTASKILWVRGNEPEKFARIRKIMLPKDYIAFKLTGQFCTDMSDASGTNLLNVSARNWSRQMLTICGLQEEQMPALYESYQKVGVVKKDIQDLLGLSDSVFVAAGAGDQAAGAVGTGAVLEGNLSIALGTSGVIFAPNQQFTLDAQHGLHSFAHANGKWHQMGVILSAASSLKWWVESIQKQDDFNQIIQEAAAIKAGANKLVFLPYLIGERTPHNNPDARGVFVGLNISHTRADMTRAILEGVIFAMRDSLELLRNAGVNVENAVISGGGAKSDLWNQITSDILNIKVRTLQANEGPAFGAAILAAVADNCFANVEEGCAQLVQYEKEFIPDNQNVQIYDRQYAVFQKLYGELTVSFQMLKNL